MKEIYKIIHNFKIDKKFWTYDELTGDDYTFRRSKPSQYIKTTIKIAQHLNLKTFVEIGSTRYAVSEKCLEYYNKENEAFVAPPCCCDGHCGFFFTESGFDVYSVDIDENCKIQNEWSYNNLTPQYAEKHLEAFQAAEPRLSDIHLILIDDTDYLTPDGGKDLLLSPYLIDKGYIPLFNGRQTLFINTLNIN